MYNLYHGEIRINAVDGTWDVYVVTDTEIRQSIALFHGNIEHYVCELNGGVLSDWMWYHPHWNVNTPDPTASRMELPFEYEVEIPFGFVCSGESADSFRAFVVDRFGENLTRVAYPNVFEELLSDGSKVKEEEEHEVSQSQEYSAYGLISGNYEEDEIYSGQQEYHDHHGWCMNEPVVDSDYGYKFGVELEVECFDEDSLDTLTCEDSNWFYHETDGSLGDYGDEIITVPLRREDALDEAFWKPMVDLAKRNASSWDRDTTGLHVHISRTILGEDANEQSETIGKLLYFYHHCIGEDSYARRLNEKLYGRKRTYNEHDGKTDEGKAAYVLGESVLAMDNIKTKVKDAMIDKSRSTRYFDINLQNDNTIEFRKGKGSINTDRIVAICAWSEAMVLYCKDTGWAELSFSRFLEIARRNKYVRNILDR